MTTRANGKVQFNLKAGNGQTMLGSEGYSFKSSCKTTPNRFGKFAGRRKI
ncbi:YegP family protein [Spirosoma pollinicola]|nr:YegP family protein [Spirosoma pollinicola]